MSFSLITVAHIVTSLLHSFMMVQLSPQVYLDGLLNSRGHSIKRYEALKSAYHNKPTPLQKASYDIYVVDIVKRRDAAALREVLASGISQNPCNNFSESFASLACRRGSSEILKVLLEAGCDIQIADDYGRTCLHEACFAAEPNWKLVEMLLDRDADLLFLSDCRDFLPLAHVQPKHWGAWIQFFESKKDRYWPKQKGKPEPPVLALLKPDSRPVPNPKKALSIELARMVVSGRMSPEKAVASKHDDSNHDESECDSDVDFDDDDDNSNMENEGVVNHNSVTDTDFEAYESEMADIMEALDNQLASNFRRIASS